MAKKKPKDWTLTEPEATVAEPAPVAPAPEPEPEFALTSPEPKPALAPRVGKESFSTYVSAGTGLELRKLALALTEQRGGVRVSVTDLADEAFKDLLRKYRQR